MECIKYMNDNPLSISLNNSVEEREGCAPNEEVENRWERMGELTLPSEEIGCELSACGMLERQDHQEESGSTTASEWGGDRDASFFLQPIPFTPPVSHLSHISHISHVSPNSHSSPQSSDHSSVQPRDTEEEIDLEELYHSKLRNFSLKSIEIPAGTEKPNMVRLSKLNEFYNFVQKKRAKKPRIGPQFQCSFLPPPSLSSSTTNKLSGLESWNPNILCTQQVEEYIQKAKNLYSRNNEEYREDRVLNDLHKCEYNIKYALSNMKKHFEGESTGNQIFKVNTRLDANKSYKLFKRRRVVGRIKTIRKHPFTKWSENKLLNPDRGPKNHSKEENQPMTVDKESMNISIEQVDLWITEYILSSYKLA